MTKTEERRRNVFQYIADYLDENGYPPSYREIGSAVGIPSTSTVSADVHALIEKKVLSMDRNSYRSLQIIRVPDGDQSNRLTSSYNIRDDVFDIPVFGPVAAGAPIYADDHVEESIPLPSSFFHNDGADYFILEIHGESMIEAGIYDGDHVIVRKQDYARNGQQVVALIEDSATVKTYYQHKDHIELRPENASMDPILVKDCRILGIVSGLYRLY
ncbi:transcriptional repressor LexA [Kallipyga massiliensis]|uniref:transcriptional repressor LexA n=1 Tax=Kallipyga massiliensis TaxID=1472764 RepID=UPI0004BB8066|nr:transcriptional repressor LexA [Kallipyga massiliensis]